MTRRPGYGYHLPNYVAKIRDIGAPKPKSKKRRRSRTPETERLLREVAVLADGTLTPREVADRLKVPVEKIYTIVRLLRKEKEVVPFANRNPHLDVFVEMRKAVVRKSGPPMPEYVKRVRPSPPREPSERNKEVFQLYQNGITYVEIAKRFNISAPRARQIVQNILSKQTPSTV